jgi:glucose-1-phosphate adenylyltransferase
VLQSNLRNALVCDGSYLDQTSVNDSIIGIRTIIHSGAKIRRSVLLGSDYYEHEANGHAPHAVPIGIGENVELDRVIVDKNARIGNGARLINTRAVQEADGDGYHIRNGIIIVPKDATIAPGLTV